MIGSRDSRENTESRWEARHGAKGTMCWGLLDSADISAPHQLVYSQLRRTHGPCSHGGIVCKPQNYRKKADSILTIMN